MQTEKILVVTDLPAVLAHYGQDAGCSLVPWASRQTPLIFASEAPEIKGCRVYVTAEEISAAPAECEFFDSVPEAELAYPDLPWASLGTFKGSP